MVEPKKRIERKDTELSQSKWTIRLEKSVRLIPLVPYEKNTWKVSAPMASAGTESAALIGWGAGAHFADYKSP